MNEGSARGRGGPQDVRSLGRDTTPGRLCREMLDAARLAGVQRLMSVGSRSLASIVPLAVVVEIKVREAALRAQAALAVIP